jgi:hypothetical protein
MSRPTGKTALYSPTAWGIVQPPGFSSSTGLTPRGLITFWWMKRTQPTRAGKLFPSPDCQFILIPSGALLSSNSARRNEPSDHSKGECGRSSYRLGMRLRQRAQWNTVVPTTTGISQIQIKPMERRQLRGRTPRRLRRSRWLRLRRSSQLHLFRNHEGFAVAAVAVAKQAGSLFVADNLSLFRVKLQGAAHPI